MEDLKKRVELLEFQQRLLMKMLKDTDDQLYYLFIKKNLTKAEAERLVEYCEKMSKEFEKRKAEGFVTFSPLLCDLKKNLPPDIAPEELIAACLQQGVFVPFMQQMRKELS